MGSSYAGFVLDPSKCSKLTMEEKRELVYQISKWSDGAPEMLQSWSRRELLEILCAEMGKERKYTGLTKIKMIEHLLKIVSEKNLATHDAAGRTSHPIYSNSQTSSKRPRKVDHLVRVPIPVNHYPNESKNLINLKCCTNLACRASLRSGDAFCKRCSCCICYNYDDNKDPSLWLVCSSERLDGGKSCGLSCHLECALKNEGTGILKVGPHPKLDGSFYCASCKNVNDLLGCWRKQLKIAKDTRRVDTLCYRVFLGHKLLSGTKKYQNIHEIVDTAAKKLEAEVGPLDGSPVKKARGIVNRLSSGAEIQKLCSSAVEILDYMQSTHSLAFIDFNTKDTILIAPITISFEHVSPTSLTLVLGLQEDALSEELVGYTVWHRKADGDYPIEATGTLLKPNNHFLVTDLTQCTDYIFKVVSFGDRGELDKWEARITTTEEVRNSLLNHSSDGDESNITGFADLNRSPQSTLEHKSEMPSFVKLSAYECKDICAADRSESSDQGEMPTVYEDVGTALGSTPSSTIQTESQRDSTNSSDENQASAAPKPKNKNQPESQLLDEMSVDNESNANAMGVQPCRRAESVLPVIPCRQENSKDVTTRNGMKSSAKPEKEPLPGASSKKRNAGTCQEDTHTQDGPSERDYEYCVKVIRWLECEGHVERNFRVKFLTWFSLKATPQERRIVSVYVDTLVDDPPSLAGQLVDTFSEGICSERSPAALTGFCMKLWH